MDQSLFISASDSRKPMNTARKRRSRSPQTFAAGVLPSRYLCHSSGLLFLSCKIGPQSTVSRLFTLWMNNVARSDKARKEEMRRELRARPALRSPTPIPHPTYARDGARSECFGSSRPILGVVHSTCVSITIRCKSYPLSRIQKGTQE